MFNEVQRGPGVCQGLVNGGHRPRGLGFQLSRGSFGSSDRKIWACLNENQCYRHKSSELNLLAPMKWKTHVFKSIDEIRQRSSTDNCHVQKRAERRSFQTRDGRCVCGRRQNGCGFAQTFIEFVNDDDDDDDNDDNEADDRHDEVGLRKLKS